MLLRLIIALAVLTVAGVAWAAEPGAGSGITLPVAVALGAVQGLTEFLPVSSSGHLALAQAFFGVDPGVGGHRFSIVAHGGTLLAVLWMYRRDVVELAKVPLRPGTPSPARQTLLMMVVATLPLFFILIPGVEESVVEVESHPRLVGGCLLVTATILFVAFRRKSEAGIDFDPAPPSLRQAILIGCAQLVAVLPGVSRSGSTIAAGLGVGLSRAGAARFSFLISIPAIVGATLLELRKLLREDSGAIDPLPYVVGFLVSFVIGLACLRLLLLIVRHGRINGFVIYLAIVGTTAIILGW
jgi:undecaprenyl-diphosphatase